MKQGMTRAEQQADTIYMDNNGTVFYTPDGIGRIYFDSLADARAEHSPRGPLIQLSRPAEDY